MKHSEKIEEVFRKLSTINEMHAMYSKPFPSFLNPQNAEPCEQVSTEHHTSDESRIKALIAYKKVEITKSSHDYTGLKEVMEKIKALSQTVIDELNKPEPSDRLISDLAVEELDEQVLVIGSIIMRDYPIYADYYAGILK
jgi:hypothetical protein